MILDLGLIEYGKAHKMQKELVARRKDGEIHDSLIIAEHPGVFTIGRSGERRNLLVDERSLGAKNIRLLTVDRGGDITFHGPGQLVIYPIIDLKSRGKDLHLYMKDLEAVGIDFLKMYSVTGERVRGKRGVWVGGEKLAFIGIAASNWITYHGLSINIDPDLRFFSMINPCGLENIGVTSLERILGRRIDMEEAKARMVSCFTGRFNIGAEYAEDRTAELVKETPFIR